MLKSGLFFVGTVVDTAILVSIVATQLVLADIAGFGVDISMGDRLMATVHDLLNFGPTLLVLIGVSFAVAFLVAFLAHRRFGGNRTTWYMVAGLTSFPAMIFLLRAAMGVTLIAAARNLTGLILLSLCCMAGGWAFAWLTSRFGNGEKADA